MITDPTARPAHIAYVDNAVKKGAGCKDYTPRPNLRPIRKHDARHSTAYNLQTNNLTRQDRQILLQTKRLLHARFIPVTVGLRARTLHRWSFSAVQQPKLYARIIRDTPHDAIERVNFSYQMPLTQPTNCWIARHHPNIGQTQRDQNCSCTHPGRRCRRFCTSMPTANDNDIKMFHVKQPSFSDAETGEDFPKQHLHVHPANQAFQRSGGSPQMLRRDLGLPCLYLICGQF